MNRTPRWLLLALPLLLAPSASAQSLAIRAGRLVDPETATVLTGQVILVEDGRFSAIGPDVANDCANALAMSLITDPELVPADTLAALEPLLGKYIDRSSGKLAWRR